MSCIVGVKYNGELIRFERRVVRLWQRGLLRDPMLQAALESCEQFKEGW